MPAFKDLPPVPVTLWTLRVSGNKLQRETPTATQDGRLLKLGEGTGLLEAQTFQVAASLCFRPAVGLFEETELKGFSI